MESSAGFMRLRRYVIFDVTEHAFTVYYSVIQYL